MSVPKRSDRYSDEISDNIYRENVCLEAHKLATHVAREMDQYSRIIDRTQEENITRFDRDEMVLGDLLGSGGFNNVFELDEIDLLDEELMIVSDQQRNQRTRMAMNIESKQYAVKFLKYELVNNPQEYCNGAADLVIETKILANMTHHPNIIRLYGMSEAGMSGFAEDVEGSYFLILDRLTETLNDRIKNWNNQVIKPSINDRLKVAYDLSYALKHVHKHNIIFRDLKPDNVGFDKNGMLKLFDFGLAKELQPQQRVSEDQYTMSGATGSLRYMAPEVALSKPYGLSADVFSYAILFWEIFSLEEPFKGMTTGQHLKHVLKGSYRPQIHKGWPDKVAKILRWSWMQDPSTRPMFKDIKKAIGREITAQEGQTSTASTMNIPNTPVEKKLKATPQPELGLKFDSYKKTSSFIHGVNGMKPSSFKVHQEQKSLHDLVRDSRHEGKSINPTGNTFKNPFRVMKNRMGPANSKDPLLKVLGEAANMAVINSSR